MKNRIVGDGKEKLTEITIQVFQKEYGQLKEIAGILGVTPAQVVEALINGQAEDYLERQNDDIWGALEDYLRESFGDTPRLKLFRRYMAACDANSELPSIVERKTLWGSLRTFSGYRRYLASLGAEEDDVSGLAWMERERALV